MIVEWTEIMLFQKLNQGKEAKGLRERGREVGKYGYLLRIIPV